MITANIASSGPNYRHSERNRDSFTSVDLKDLVEERDNLEVGGFLKTILVSLFVCFKGGMGTGVYPGSPLCLTDMSIFAEIPKVVNSLCTIENSVFGIRMRKQYLFDS